jgi:hypothetical protein
LIPHPRSPIDFHRIKKLKGMPSAKKWEQQEKEREIQQSLLLLESQKT